MHAHRHNPTPSQFYKRSTGPILFMLSFPFSFSARASVKTASLIALVPRPHVWRGVLAVCVFGTLTGQAAAAQGSSAPNAEPDLDDCQVLLGRQQAQAFGELMNQVRTEAGRGDLPSQRVLTQILNNTMVCQEEAQGIEPMWTVQQEGLDAQGHTVDTEVHAPQGIPDLKKVPEAERALRDLISAAHAAGDADPGYKALGANWVLKYAKQVPDLLQQGYEDAAGAYQFDCVRKGQYGRRLRDSACKDDRAMLRQFAPLLPVEARYPADQRAASWAKRVNLKSAEH